MNARGWFDLWGRWHPTLRAAVLSDSRTLVFLISAALPRTPHEEVGT